MLHKIEKIHNEAMSLVDKADIAKLNKDTKSQLYYLNKAFKKEKEAAFKLRDSELEPSRSILFRSAASIAFELKYFKEAEQLVCFGLSGNPPYWVAEELKDIYENINFHRHLELRGVKLDDEEFQMSLTGDAVGFGVCESEEFILRVDVLTKMIQRTVQRKTNPSEKLGRLSQNIKSIYTPYISIPRAASYAVSFRLSCPNEQLELFKEINKQEIIDEVLESIELFEKEDFQALHDKIQEEPYFNNFIGLCEKLLPDGKNITSVGFTTIRYEKEKKVLLKKKKTNLLAEKIEPEEMNLLINIDKGDEVIIQGILKVADKSLDKPEIKIHSNGIYYRVRVPEGIMDDIVRPLWDREVILSGIKHSKTIIILNKIQY